MRVLKKVGTWIMTILLTLEGLTIDLAKILVIIYRKLRIVIIKKLRLTLSILSILFWIAASPICDLIYPNDALYWWFLKSDFYVLVIGICYFLMTLKSSDDRRIKFIEDFMIRFGFIFAGSNTIDRWINDSRFFSWASYYPLILIAVVAYFSAKRLNKIVDKHKPIA